MITLVEMRIDYSTKTNRPLKPCKPGYEINPITNRCRKVWGRCVNSTIHPAKQAAMRPAKKAAIRPAKKAAMRPAKKAVLNKKTTWKDVIRS